MIFILLSNDIYILKKLKNIAPALQPFLTTAMLFTLYFPTWFIKFIFISYPTKLRVKATLFK